LSGYSQGGQLVHNAAKLLPAETAQKIAGAVTFGDPGTQAGETYLAHTQLSPRASHIMQTLLTTTHSYRQRPIVCKYPSWKRQDLLSPPGQHLPERGAHHAVSLLVFVAICTCSCGLCGVEVAGQVSSRLEWCGRAEGRGQESRPDFTQFLSPGHAVAVESQAHLHATEAMLTITNRSQE
jgi:hypothetical protein